MERFVKYCPGIVVKYHGPTNSKGSRISLECNEHKLNRVYFDFSYESSNSLDQAMKILSEYGFHIVATTATKEFYLVLVDFIGSLRANWEKIKGAKK